MKRDRITPPKTSEQRIEELELEVASLQHALKALFAQVAVSEPIPRKFAEAVYDICNEFSYKPHDQDRGFTSKERDMNLRIVHRSKEIVSYAKAWVRAYRPWAE